MPSTVAPLCLMIDALTEVWIEVMSLEGLAMDARSNMVTMLSIGGVIGPLAGMVICEFASWLADIRAVMIIELCEEVVALKELLLICWIAFSC